MNLNESCHVNADMSKRSAWIKKWTHTNESYHDMHESCHVYANLSERLNRINECTHINDHVVNMKECYVNSDLRKRLKCVNGARLSHLHTACVT